MSADLASAALLQETAAAHAIDSSRTIAARMLQPLAQQREWSPSSAMTSHSTTAVLHCACTGSRLDSGSRGSCDAALPPSPPAAQRAHRQRCAGLEHSMYGHCALHLAEWQPASALPARASASVAQASLSAAVDCANVQIREHAAAVSILALFSPLAPPEMHRLGFLIGAPASAACVG